MEWYNHLYVGKKAKKHRFDLIQKIRHDEFDPVIHVIIPARNGNNILDVFPMLTWMLHHKQHPDTVVLGIADGYADALDVVKQIVEDMYQKTGGFDLQAFLQ